MISDQTTRFDEWEDIVDCNDCEAYWLNQCDGTLSNGSNSLCTAFKAIRGVNIPKKIKSLEIRLFWLTVAVVFLSTAMTIYLFAMGG